MPCNSIVQSKVRPEKGGVRQSFPQETGKIIMAFDIVFMSVLPDLGLHAFCGKPCCSYSPTKGTHRLFRRGKPFFIIKFRGQFAE